MVPRDPHEHPRAATPLELLYDLCFVVAVAQAATGLHHSIAEGHGIEGAAAFGLVFFAVWWAWMNFAWFASAFDTDDALYRLKVLVQIVGVLVLAAGVPRAFGERDFTLVTFGYLIMRVGLVAQWLRAARADAALRPTARRYALGVSLVQVGWLALLAAPAERWIFGWLVLVPLELAVPWWAERTGRTPWHPHHIAERYGLFTIIVIGESVLAATVAIQSAIDLNRMPGELLAVIVSAPVILFAMWWLYFSCPAHRLLTSLRAAMVWGYGHFFVFASAAAVGAGLAAAVDRAVGEAHLTARAAGAALALPVAVYLAGVWFVQVRRSRRSRLEGAAYAIVCALVLAAPWMPAPAPAIAASLAVLTAVGHRCWLRQPAG